MKPIIFKWWNYKNNLILMVYLFYIDSEIKSSPDGSIISIR